MAVVFYLDANGDIRTMGDPAKGREEQIISRKHYVPQCESVSSVDNKYPSWSTGWVVGKTPPGGVVKLPGAAPVATFPTTTTVSRLPVFCVGDRIEYRASYDTFTGEIVSIKNDWYYVVRDDGITGMGPNGEWAIGIDNEEHYMSLYP